ncbi:uncharacterized protein [Palaemon carinicauda]|uniref:uncharacterized protein n=1 Tax=Palaemon carinicauda TaxID=392227 RepID=UPI0035B5853F
MHINVVGPLPPSGGDCFLLTFIDRFTRWIKATPMESSSTDSCVSALLSSWISRFSVPDVITTNRGPAFLSDVWGALTKSFGITAHSTTSYNPAGHGMVKWGHRSLKASLMARCSNDNWNAQLPLVLLGQRTASRSNGESSPAKKFYGDSIAVLSEFFPASSNENNQTLERIRNAVSKFTLCHQTVNNTTKTFMPQVLRTCDFVFIHDDAHRPSLRRLYKGPYQVIDRNPKA